MIQIGGVPMSAIADALRRELRDPEYSEGYAESFLNAFVATQIKVLREQNGWRQSDLASILGTTQTGISRVENVNYSAWSIGTLKKLARAFRVRLKVSFETYGSLIEDVEQFGRESLQRVPREADPVLHSESQNMHNVLHVLIQPDMHEIPTRQHHYLHGIVGPHPSLGAAPHQFEFRVGLAARAQATQGGPGSVLASGLAS